MHEVTIVAHDAGGVGGMERQLEELITGLADATHEVLVIARGLRVAPHPRIRWIRIRGPARPFALAYPWFLLVASIVLRRRRRGVVHSTGAIVANRVDVITAHFCHRAYRERTRLRRSSGRSLVYRLNARVAARMSLAAEAWSYRPSRVTRMVGVSRGVTAELERHFPVPAERLQTVPNGVDTDRFCPGSPDARRVARASLGIGADRLVTLFVGSEWEGKGLVHALEAVSRRSGCDLLVVGRGDLDRYGRIVRDLGITERVTFLEPRPDLLPLYRAADVFLLPTVYETFSLVSHEAAACGLALLVTRVSGVDELLEDGENGWFIRRDPADIATRLAELEADPDGRERLGAAARRSALRYSWPAMVRGYRSVYDAVMEEARS